MYCLTDSVELYTHLLQKDLSNTKDSIMETEAFNTNFITQNS